MSWIEKLSDPKEMHRCIRDLVALSTLSAMWTHYGPQEIAESVTSALVTMLEADFMYIAFPLGRDEPSIEVAHVSGGPRSANTAGTIGRAITPKWLRMSGRAETIPNPLGDGILRLATAPIGLGSEAILLGGWVNPNFPTETQRGLIGIAANNATIALQRWQAEADAQRFIALVERSSDFVAFSDLEGRPQYINGAGQDLVGLGATDDLHLRNVLDFVDPDDKARARQEGWQTALRDGRWVGELHFRHFKTGEAIPFSIEAFRIDDPRSGRPMNVATVSRDLRAQRQAENKLRRLNESLERRVEVRNVELADANEKLGMEMMERGRADARTRELQISLSHAGRLSAAGQMAAALAHELSQPLAAVSNSANAARRLLAQGGHRKIETVREIMDEVAGQALRAGQILRRLRDFVTRGESEKQVENVQMMIEEASVFALMGSKLVDPQIRFDFSPDVCSVFVNRIQIQQVLVNIMSNALEAMAGMQRCELIVSMIRLDNGMIEVAVADCGPGLPMEIADRLFEPFVSTKHDGMGLGLSLSRSLVEAHGGTLRYEPNPEGGSIFRFTIPCATTDENNVH